MKILELEDCCVVEGCKAPFKDLSLVFDQIEFEVVVACSEHGDHILELTHPEYTSICHNCGCESGIN